MDERTDQWMTNGGGQGVNDWAVKEEKEEITRMVQQPPPPTTKKVNGKMTDRGV